MISHESMREYKVLTYAGKVYKVYRHICSSCDEVRYGRLWRGVCASCSSKGLRAKLVLIQGGKS